MSKVIFEEEELMVIAIFELEDRQETIKYIEESKEFIEKEDEDLVKLMEQAIKKLTALTDEEYQSYDFAMYLTEADAEDTENA